MPARALMVLGTASNAGKSALCAALCRALAQRGVRVAPFKAQNTSLNSCVTPRGEEIARAQAFQAAAAGVPPEASMNPILLKPEGNGKSNIVVLGRPQGTLTIDRYWARRSHFATAVRRAYKDLASRFDVLVLEGAGGAAEINLRDRDLANSWTAELADASVILVADIDRGGVFASLYGTWALLSPSERKRIHGFVINRLKGEVRHLGDGPEQLTRLTGVPVLGVIPDVPDLNLDAEDSLNLDRFSRTFFGDSRRLRVAVIRFPHVANFTDLDPLANEPGVDLTLINDPGELRRAHVILLPGSKKTVADLAWMNQGGMARAIEDARRRGAILMGLCGGFQMMGKAIRDPAGVESNRRVVRGLGLLPTETRFQKKKTLAQVRARCALPYYRGTVTGYEVHCGKTPIGGAKPAFRIELRNGRPVRTVDGVCLDGGRLLGCYIHGLFENDSFRRSFLAWARQQVGLPRALSSLSFARARLKAIDRWTRVVESSIDLEALFAREGLVMSTQSRAKHLVQSRGVS